MGAVRPARLAGLKAAAKMSSTVAVVVKVNTPKNLNHKNFDVPTIHDVEQVV